jgi:hypothetical protein
MGGNDKAMLRAKVRGSKRRNRWRLGIASFRRHFKRGRKEIIGKTYSGKNR